MSYESDMASAYLHPGENIFDGLVRTMKEVFSELYIRQQIALKGGYESDSSTDSSASAPILVPEPEEIQDPQPIFAIKYFIDNEFVKKITLEQILIREGGNGIGEYDIYEMSFLQSIVLPVNSSATFVLEEIDGAQYGSVTIDPYELYMALDYHPNERIIMSVDGWEVESDFNVDYEGFLFSALVNKEYDISSEQWVIVLSDIFNFHPVFKQ